MARNIDQRAIRFHVEKYGRAVVLRRHAVEGDDVRDIVVDIDYLFLEDFRDDFGESSKMFRHSNLREGAFFERTAQSRLNSPTKITSRFGFGGVMYGLRGGGLKFRLQLEQRLPLHDGIA